MRLRRRVPLGVAADHAGHVVRAVRGDEAEIASGDQQRRRLVVVGLVDRHRRVLDADRPVQQRAHRLAGRLPVAMRHRHRRLLVQRGDELRHHVRRIAVVDERFLNALEARPGIRGDVFDAEIPQHLHHQVRPRPHRGPRVPAGRRTHRTRIALELRRRWRRRRGIGSAPNGRLRLRVHTLRNVSGDRCSAGGRSGRTLQKATTVDGELAGFRHRLFS